MPPDDSNTALAEKKPRDFPTMLQIWKPQIELALPKHMTADRVCRIALTEFRKNEKLSQCDPLSVFASVLQSAQTGLEIGVLGQAFLVPYKDGGTYVCQFIPGWQGLVDLVNRAGNASVWTGAVFDGDQFDWALGDRPFVTHRPAGENDPEKMTHVYAIGRVKGAEWPIIEVWTLDRVRRHRDRYNKVGAKHYSYKNFEMYARKIPLLQVLKYLPKSPELTRAIAMNDAAEVGEQRFGSVTDALEGSFSAIPNDNGHDDKAGWPEDKFNDKLPGWRKSIVEGRRTAEEVFAMAESLTPLSESQKAAIRGEQQKPAEGTAAPTPPNGDAPAAPEVVEAMKQKARAATISDAELCKQLKIESLSGITSAQVDRALAFIADPVGD